MRFSDLTGKRFSELIAIRPTGKNHQGNTLWLCRCNCGKEIIAINSNLTRGNTKSCGCIGSKKIIERNTTHGCYATPLYSVWRSMKERCFTASCSAYSDYGGRGITICEEWKSDFLAFREWAMSGGFAEGLTIDRIDNNGNYEPENCRWVTQIVQANNKRNNRYITVGGITSSLADTCRAYNASYKKVWKRLRRGWEIEKALSGAD